MNILIAIIGLLFTSISYGACFNDYNCGYGQRCVKTNAYGTGLCVKIKNEYGLDSIKQNYDNYGRTGNGKVVSGCMFTTDCAYGYTCYKKAGHIRGLCLK